MLPPRIGRRCRRRSAAAAAAAVAPYRKKAKDRRIKKKGRKASGGDTAVLSDDVLAGIFAGLSDGAAVVRCAATCRRWCRVVAKSSAIISRTLPPVGRFMPDLAVGLFHRETDLPAAESPLPCFVPMASAARFLGAGQPQRLLSVAGLGDAAGGLLDHSRPVASRNGRLVLELRREGAADGLRLAVCNPMMSDNNNSIVLAPPLLIPTEGSNAIGDYGCALLTGQDLRPPRANTFFRLLLVYNHDRGPGNGSSTVLRCYCSDTGRWGREAECSVQVPSSKICELGQAVVRRGVAFWAMDVGVLGARLDEIDQHGAVMDMHLVPYDKSPYPCPDSRLLGISPDNNRLFFLSFGVVGVVYAGWQLEDMHMIMVASLDYLEFTEEDNIRTGTIRFGRGREHVRMPQMKVSHPNAAGIRLRWFGEKSGLVLFTMGRPSGHSGTFVLNLHDKVVTKLAIFGDSWKNLLGYEMDMAAYLASSLVPAC